MEELILREVQSLSSQFPHWDEVMEKYDKHMYEIGVESALEERVSTMQEVLGIYETILKVCTRCGRFRDTWDFPVKYYLLPFGHEALLHSDKMGVEFTLGQYQRQLFLRSGLHAPSYLSRVGNSFWSCFLELELLGEFSFQANGLPASEEARKVMRRLKSGKSSIFQVIRNYMCFEIFGGHIEDLGWLEVKWPVTLPWSDLIARAVKAFRCIYKINYTLYRYGGPAFNADGFNPSVDRMPSHHN
jgi:hypothetical protein